MGAPATYPHAYVRGGTTKLLTLCRPATGQLWAEPVTHAPNAVLHPWLQRELTKILASRPAAEPVDAEATRAAWAVWQAGLNAPFTLPSALRPQRVLLV
ncbi:MAG: hypothetical protein QOF51_829 [Chloroflexota bacterium]|jgi:hypothetical protein|nr:hypothetical protein [Chloroflexota bacterium]